MSEVIIFKRCTCCGQEKSLADFRRQAKNKDGLKYTCRDCDDERNKKRYQAKKEILLQQVKVWQAANPEKVKMYKRRYKAKKLGTTST